MSSRSSKHKSPYAMRTATTIAVALLLVGVTDLFAQKTDVAWAPDTTSLFGFPAGYMIGLHSGARSVAGPFDLDNDGKVDILVSDYTGGGRVHMLESAGVDLWEHVYSTRFIDSTGTTENARGITGGDLDGDGMGEIIMFAGRGYNPANPIAALLPPGLYALEATGDNTFAVFPSGYYFDDDLPDRWRTEQLTVSDVDGDGVNELMFGNNGRANAYDSWYVLSVTGDVGTPFAVWTEEARWSSRASEAFDPVLRGGGSPYGIIPANLDGGSGMEIAMQSWNNLNFTNALAVAPDVYAAPTAADTAAWRQASTSDHVALFGCVAVDMDDNGDDEVYCPTYTSGHVTLLNYEAEEDPLEVNAFNIAHEVIKNVSSLGITAGDIDNDGVMELIGSGPAYTGSAYSGGAAPGWITIVDYGSGDVEDPANYSVRNIPFPEDMVNGFNTVNRDSVGKMTTYFENGGQGPEFTAKLAYLGDPDGDGFNEVAISMQGVDDSVYVYNEVYNPADSTYVRTTAEASAHPNRVFLRVISGDGLTTKITEERVIVPTDYVLSANYPNPFNPSTSFSFTLPLDKRISVRIYDITGRLVRTLVNYEWFTAGKHQATWDGQSDSGLPVASGTYIYSLQYGNFQQARRMLLIK